MRLAILITVITLMVAGLAPAFAGEELYVSQVEPLIAEQVVQKPLEVANDQSFEIQTQPAESTETSQVDYTVQSYDIKPAEVKPSASALGAQVNTSTCLQVVYTTQSSTPEGGFKRPSYITGGSESPVPEPSSILALAVGFGGLILRPWKRRK